MNATNVLKDNLNKLSIISKSKIHNNKIEDILKKNINEKFHIFFFDPPFSDFDFYQNLKLIKKNKIYFIHLNHSNPLFNKNSKEYSQVKQQGFNIAETGMKFIL